MSPSLRRALTVLALTLLLVPAGLLTEAPAWGEWELEELERRLGFVPRGLAEARTWVPGLLPEYTLEGAPPVVGYLLSALVGVGAILLLFGLIYLVVRPRSHAG